MSKGFGVPISFDLLILHPTWLRFIKKNKHQQSIDKTFWKTNLKKKRKKCTYYNSIKMKYPDIRTLQGLLHLTNLEKSCFEARFQHGPSIKTSQEIGEKYSLYPHVWSNHAEIPTFFKCPYTLVHHPSSSTGSFEGLPPQKKSYLEVSLK